MQRLQNQVLLLTCYVILDKPHKTSEFLFLYLEMIINCTYLKVNKIEYDDVCGKVLQSERQAARHLFILHEAFPPSLRDLSYCNQAHNLLLTVSRALPNLVSVLLLF